MNVNRVLYLILFVFISTGLSGCLLRDMVDAKRLEDMDVQLNPWLGKTKDERMKVIGTPVRCAALSTGGEVCEWVFSGVSDVHCPPDAVYGGHRCSEGGSWEDRIMFTYDTIGIATEWNYNGSLGQRSSKDSQEQSIKEVKLNDKLSQTKPKMQDVR